MSADPDQAERAVYYLREAYRNQMAGELDRAIDLYQKSIECYPTAEAYTFLGWTYSFRSDYDRAIAYCKRAIETDPTFGNPYNDIGAYLIALGRFAESIPWLERALHAERYESYHFAHLNMGRAHEALGKWHRARECYQAALELEPNYPNAVAALAQLQSMLN